MLSLFSIHIKKNRSSLDIIEDRYRITPIYSSFDESSNKRRVEDIFKTIKKRTFNAHKHITTCNKFKESYIPRYFHRPSSSEMVELVQDYLIEILYSFSSFHPLEENPLYSQCFTANQFRDISYSVRNKNANYTLELEANLDFLLNKFLREFNNSKKVRYQIVTKDPNILRNKLQIMYEGVMKMLFSNPDPSLTEEIENIVFNMIIPFGNKMHCLFFEVAKHEFCQKCLGIKDAFTCCSFSVFTEDMKAAGEQSIRKAVEFARAEVNVETKNRKIFFFKDGFICFWIKYPMNLFQSNIEKYIKENP